MPISYKLTLVGFAFGNAVLCFLLERFVSQSQGVKKASHAVLGKKDPRNRFRTIMRDINNLEDWPPKTSANLQQVSLSNNRMGGESLKNRASGVGSNGWGQSGRSLGVRRYPWLYPR